jgi:serine/threonine-protein kinase
VYRAYDSSLKRNVALKLLRGGDPERLSRFQREAQAQARVDHDNVCRVYDVGELDGGAYIAMQLIEGQSLFLADGESVGPSPALREMSVEQKVRILQKVAEAIHAAHREGLIHRDIKPSNIMLERGEDGAFKPYVLDFGLAREVTSAGVTSLGLAAGTPSYMAPEQARGDAAALDRRTDVYGLGATLYALLSGHAPFEGPSSLDVLMKVTEQEPPPLPAVPGDLATIVAKSLQKEPSQRYDSARALAEDLSRYLDGEPIHARRTSLGYRIVKKARKHWKLVASAAAVASGFLILGALSLRAQLLAQERARLAGLFGQEVKAIESQMRIAHMAPEHDIGNEKAAVRERMDRIAAQVGRMGRLAQAPGHYALGRGHLALKDYDKAREHLERAWQDGYRDGEVAYALGQTLGSLYQRELELAERISDKDKREERKRQLEREYRDPALARLREARELQLDSRAYAEALVAFYEKRYDEALSKAKAAYSEHPWLYEARLLEAQVYSQSFRERKDLGQYEAAVQLYAQADDAYRKAQETGRSEPSIREGMCRLETSFILLELYAGKGAVEPHFEKGLKACDEAIHIDPERVEAYGAKSHILCRMGEGYVKRGGDPRQHLMLSIEAAREGLHHGSDDAPTYLYMGIAYGLQGWYEDTHGLDPRKDLREGQAVLEKAMALDPADPNPPNALGLTFKFLGNYEWRHGRDAQELWRRGEEALRRAIAVQPTYVSAYANLSMLYGERTRDDLTRGIDPREGFQLMEEASRACYALNPRQLNNLDSWGEGAVVRARHTADVGEDPREMLEKAVEIAQRALAINPKHAPSLAHMAEVQEIRARFELEQGRDPQPALRVGADWVGKAQQSDPGLVAVLLAGARLALLEGRWQAARGRDPGGVLERARRRLQQAVEIDREALEAWTAMAEVSGELAEWKRQRGGDASEEIARGLSAIEVALAVNPRDAEALAIRGALHLAQARLEKRDAAGYRRQAHESLEQALALDPYLGRRYGPLLQSARAQKQRADEGAVSRGRARR